MRRDRKPGLHRHESLFVPFLLFVPFVFLIAQLRTTHAADSRKPNIVLIVADDLGWNDVSYHNSPDLKTPVLDRLARQGVQLDRFYVYPSCSPTRACLLSGRNASRFAIPGPIGIDGGKSHLPLDSVTLPKLLKQRGYATALVGKWHLGATNEVGPRKFGFDYFYGYPHGQVDQFTHESWDLDPIWQRNEESIKDDGHATDLFAREACDFIRTHAGVGKKSSPPFFLELCFSVPHYPLQDTEEWLAKYAHIADPDRRTYAAMVSHMDEAVGRVVAALDQAKVRGNTLVLFTSDNGGQRDWLVSGRYGGKHGMYRTLGNNAPLRGWKVDLYEGGVRVVAFANWPGKLQPGVMKGVATACDFYPTIAALTGAPASGDLQREGMDLWPALQGRANIGPRTFHWDVGSHVGMLDGDYKLIRRVRGKLSPGEEAVELYNLAIDPLEQRNLATTASDVAARLQAKLAAELQRNPKP